MRGYLGPFRSEERPDATELSADCGASGTMVGGKRIRGKGRLYMGTLKIFQGPSWEQMAGRLIGAMRDMTTAHLNEFIRVGAGGVGVDGGALLLPSPPEPHLAALVAKLVGLGADYLGDQTVRIDPVLRRAHASPLPLLVDVRDLELFPELNRDHGARVRRDIEKLGANSPRRPVSLSELGGRASPPIPISTVVFPSFDPDGATQLQPIGRAEALVLLFRALLNGHVWRDRALVFARDLLQGTACMQLSVRSIPEAAEALLDAAPRSLTEVVS